MTQRLCWLQLNTILLEQPFVVGFLCSFIQLSKWPFIYFSAALGERAAPERSGWCSGSRAIRAPPTVEDRADAFSSPPPPLLLFPPPCRQCRRRSLCPAAANGALSSCSQNGSSGFVFQIFSLSRSSGINSQNILIFFFAQSCLSKSIIHGWSTIWVRRVCLYNQLSAIKRESVSRMRFFPIMSCTQLGASSLVTPTYFRVLQSVPLSASLSFWHGIINSTFTL